MIFVEDHEEETSANIDIIIGFFKKDYDDIGIITNNNNQISSKYATIPSIYLRFFKGDVVFLSLSSYLENENILANNIYIKTDINEIISNNITRSRIGSAKIISINEFNLEVTEYATV